MLSPPVDENPQEPEEGTATAATAAPPSAQPAPAPSPRAAPSRSRATSRVSPSHCAFRLRMIVADSVTKLGRSHFFAPAASWIVASISRASGCCRGGASSCPPLSSPPFDPGGGVPPPPTSRRRSRDCDPARSMATASSSIAAFIRARASLAFCFLRS